jgi:hypothetical protein
MTYLSPVSTGVAYQVVNQGQFEVRYPLVLASCQNLSDPLHQRKPRHNLLLLSYGLLSTYS